MKINLENMKELAHELDNSKADLTSLSAQVIPADDLLSMAYQLQYFFEAMEYISGRAEFWKDLHFKDDRARWEAYNDSITTLNKALVDKED